MLSLFFIDEVAKYKCYDEQNDAYNSTYAQMFEEEYEAQVKALLADLNLHGSNFWHYLNKHQEGNPVHAGYFSVDKIKNRIRSSLWTTSLLRKRKITSLTTRMPMI